MTRRWFVTRVACAAVVAPCPVAAQSSARVPRIGWLTNSVVHTPNREAFLAAMQALGYRDVVMETRAAGGRVERLPELAAELVALKLDAIVTDGGPAAVAAKRATSAVPIVIGATAADLVRDGLVASLARPGGNVTGFTISTGAELYGKRVELLREAIGTLSRVAVLWNPRNDIARASIGSVVEQGKGLGIQLEPIEVDIQRLEAAFAAAAQSGVRAVLTMADAFLWSQRARVAGFAAQYRLPAMYPEGEFVEAGGLMSYGPNVRDNFRRAAGYVDKILKGTKPGDLPVEQPAKFDLLVNLATARALGVTITPSLLLRADRVVE